MPAPNHRVVNGAKGGIYVADTNPHSVPSTTGSNGYGVLWVVQDCVFSAYSGNMQGLVGPTIPAGTPIFGSHGSFTLSSGALFAYFE